jgi:hypothetical protein
MRELKKLSADLLVTGIIDNCDKFIQIYQLNHSVIGVDKDIRFDSLIQ